MKKEEKASFSIIKIICVCIILVLISGIGVMAVEANLKDVKIILQNGYEMTVLTNNTKVKDILSENNIILEEDEKTTPGLEEELTQNNTIKITNISQQEIQIAQISKEGINTSLEELLKNYTPITEKIIVEQIEIPFETITKNSTTQEGTTNKVLQEGQNGIKEITYKVKYQNEEEIDRIVLSEKTIKEPVNKIVQVQKIQSQTSRSSTLPRVSSNTNESGEIYKITAYCPCAKCCGKTTGRTASGTQATAGRTVAASSKFSFGTKLNIGGHIYTVEDRGGAINGNKIDIFVNSHSEALKWGVKYLKVSIVN